MTIFEAIVMASIVALGTGCATAGFLLGYKPKPAQAPVIRAIKAYEEQGKARAIPLKPFAYAFEGETQDFWMTLTTPQYKARVEKHAKPVGDCGIRVSLIQRFTGDEVAVEYAPCIIDGRCIAEEFIYSRFKEGKQ